MNQNTINAAVHTRYGPPEVVAIRRIPRPVPKTDELLIKVHASTVNRTDCGFRSAEYFVSRFFSGLFRPKYTTLGCEFAGEIVSVGGAVKNFSPGQKVIGFNDSRFGAHAEYMTLHCNDVVVPMPTSLSYEEAAPILEGSHYALCDIRAAGIAPGQRWLINGGTGAIGSAAVQLCAYFGAEVTAVCGSAHVELVRSLGASTVIDYTQEDFTQRNETYDVVFDAVGKSSFGSCQRILKPNGIYMSTELGPRYENPFLAIKGKFTSGKKVLFPLPTIVKEDAMFLVMLVETGKFKPVIDRVYPLDRIVEAYRYVETGEKIGNVVITMT
jgi:NADPH:quinone reductase-like Zn-dependent oxidoreductase